MTVGRPRISLSERFWLQTTRRGPTECWPWRGWLDADGYGQIALPGRGSKRIRASAASWLLAHGELPNPGQYVLHRCDNPPCVNPDHLFLGTQAENCQDAVRKGRHRNARLTPEQVADIRARVAAGAVQREIAREVGVSYHQINRIVKGHSWRAEGQ